jgi:hypothetical protein
MNFNWAPFLTGYFNLIGTSTLTGSFILIVSSSQCTLLLPSARICKKVNKKVYTH